MRYEQPFDTRQSQVPATDEAGNYIYETQVAKKEQIADIQSWAKERGVTVERVYAGSEKEAKELAALPGIPLVIKSKEQLPESIEISMRSDEAIRKERAEQLGRVAGKKVYEEVGPVEKGLLHLHTVLSTKGYEYVGAATKETLAAKAKTDIVSAGGEKILDMVFPGVKGTEDIVIENISQKVTRHAQGEYSYSYTLPVVGKVEIDDRIIDAVSNPVVDVEMMFLGGAGIARLGATKAGAKVLGSTAGKVLMGAGGAAFLGSRGYEVVQLRQKGETTKALGVTVSTAAGVGAGIVGFKLESGYLARTLTPKEIKVDLSKIKGASQTLKVKDTTLSRGKFVVTEGKLKGLKGTVYAATQKKEGGLIIKIPAQKVGGVKIKAATIARHTSALNKPIKTAAGDVYVRISKEGRVIIDTGSKSARGPLVGRETEKTYVREIAKIATHATDRTGKQQNFIIRKLEGLGIGKTAKHYNVYLVRKGGNVVLVEAKAGLVNPRVAKIDWVDISKTYTPKTGFTMGGGTATTPKSTTGIKGIAIPTGTVSVKADVSLGARIVPVVNPVPTGIRIKKIDKAKTVQRTILEPSIIRSEEATKPKGRLVTPTVSVGGALTPKIDRALESARTVYTPIASSYHPITGQKVSQVEAAALTKKLEPIIDRIASQPVPIVPVTPSKPGTPFAGGLLIPFLRLGVGKVNLKKFSTGHLKNPVPNIEKVI